MTDVIELNLPEPLRNKKYLLLFVISSIFVFIILGHISVFIHIFDSFPVVFIDYSMITATPYSPFSIVIFPFFVSVLSSLTIVYVLYAREKVKNAEIAKECAACTTGLTASLFLTGCPVCIPLLLAFFGVGWGAWNSFYSTVGIPIQISVIILLMFSLYLAAKNLRKIKRKG